MENGAYANELRQVGFPTGSSVRLIGWIFVHLVPFFFSALFILPRLRHVEFTSRTNSMLLIISSFLILFYSVPIILYGPTFLNGLNRYQFLELQYVGIFNIKLLLAINCFYLGRISAGFDKAITAKFLFIFVLFLMICYGEKFSGPVNAILFFLMGQFYGFGKKTLKLRTLIKLYASVFVVLVMIYAIALLALGRDISTIRNAAENRIGREAAMWWIADYQRQNDIFYISKSIPDVLNYYEYSSESPLGNQLFKLSFMHPEEKRSHTGSVAAVYPAILYLGGEYSTLLVLSFFFAIFYWSFIFVFFTLNINGVLSLLTPFYSYVFAAFLKIFQSGNLHLLTSYWFVLIVSFMFVMRCIGPFYVKKY